MAFDACEPSEQVLFISPKVLIIHRFLQYNPSKISNSPVGVIIPFAIFCLQTWWMCALLGRRAVRGHLRKEVVTVANREASMGL